MPTVTTNYIVTGGTTSSSAFFQVAPPTITVEKTVIEVWIPPTEEVQGVEAVPPTPSTIRYNKNTGWNSWARSIGAITMGQFYEFTCSDGIEGAMLALGNASQLGSGIATFSHSLLVSVDGVRAHERGIVPKIIKNVQRPIQRMRIYFQEDRRIAYTVITENETVLYTSADKYVRSTAHVFAYIYAARDKITTSFFDSGKVQYGSV